MFRSEKTAVTAIAGLLCLAASACTVRFGGSKQDAGIPPGCGNGVLEIGEVCDGTDFAGQSCQSAIGHEAGELACTDACQLDLTGCYTCGDGEVDGPEGCDDANLNVGDGCSDTCEMEPGWVCFGEPSHCEFTCGNNQLDTGELCDDGNINDGDGCSPSCQIEPGWECSGEPSFCMPICGDGLIRGIETCDDGNLNSDDGCSAVCSLEAGWFCAGEPSDCIPACGDGMIVAGETCDDANNTDGDGCSAQCQVEAGYQCTGEPSVCNTVCGDGAIAGTETCDDANNNSGDGCSSGCQIENYHACGGEPSVCVCAVFVDIDAVSGPRNGTSWNNAFDEVQNGIDTAWNMGQNCEVWVAEGRYHLYEFSNGDHLELRTNVEVYGGFAGVETARDQRDWIAHETILDGSRAINPGQRVRTVVRATNANNAVLDGFTITNGNNTSGNGGGLRAEDPMTVANCVFINNEAEDGGGAMFRNDQFTVINCTFDSNIAQQTGGGVLVESGANLDIQNSAFLQNTAGQAGGGLYNNGSTVTITGCTFQQNTALEDGGGIHFQNGTGTIQSSTFQQNTAQNNAGGGICLDNASPTVDGCVFIDNIATVGGGLRPRGAGAQPVVQNCVFTGNTVTQWGGGGLATFMNSHPTIINCTFYENSDGPGQGAAIRNSGGQSTVINCIIRGTEPNQIFNTSGGWATVSYTNISGGYAGTNNFDADPLFVDTAGLDFHLMTGSPCIDVANGDQAPTLDADGNPRADDPNSPNNGAGTPNYADLGAFEYQP